MFPLNCHVLQLSHSHRYKTKPWWSWDYSRQMSSGGHELGGKRCLGNKGRIPIFPYPGRKKKEWMQTEEKASLFLLDRSVNFCQSILSIHLSIPAKPWKSFACRVALEAWNGVWAVAGGCHSPKNRALFPPSSHCSLSLREWEIVPEADG